MICVQCPACEMDFEVTDSSTPYYIHCLFKCKKYSLLGIDRTCSICNAMFLNQEDLDKHALGCPNGTTSEPVEETTVETVQELVFRKAETKDNKCDDCSIEFPDQQNFSCHRRAVHCDIKCPDCPDDKFYSHLNFFRRHYHFKPEYLETIPTNGLKLDHGSYFQGNKCLICSHTIGKQNVHREHFYRDHFERHIGYQFMCNYCPHSAGTAIDLRSHHNVFHRKKPLIVLEPVWILMKENGGKQRRGQKRKRSTTNVKVQKKLL